MIRIHCAKADATLLETETLTAGMMNTPSVLFTFSSDWDSLGKTAIVRAGTVIREVVLDNNQITIPPECLAKAGVNLIVGVWGGNFITELPTVWCACGEIQDSTNPAGATNHEEGTPSNVAQMLAAAERAESALNSIQGIIDQAESVGDRIEAILDIVPEHIDDNSEAWAVGTRFGEAVEPGDDTYHNNSKYYAYHAGESAQDAIEAEASSAAAMDAAATAQAQAEAARDAAVAAKTAAEAAATASVPDAVSDWLESNITDPTDPAIDTSLSVAGAAADAKTVGDALNGIQINQRVSFSPLGFGTGDGQWSNVRSSLNGIGGIGMKVSRNSDSTTNSYGFTIRTNVSPEEDITGHKIFVRVASVDLSHSSNTSTIRILGYAGNDGAGMTKDFVVNSVGQTCEYIGTPKLNANRLMVLAVPDSAPENGEYFTVGHVQWIDLTKIFGENCEPDLGEFKVMFPDFPYPYSTTNYAINRKTYQLFQMVYGNSVISIGHPDTGKIKKIIQESRAQWNAAKQIMIEKVHEQKKYISTGSHQGIPYSSIIGMGGDVYYNRSLSTFFSAVKNPASIIYKDNWSWGPYQSCNYGAVCTTMSSWLNSSPIYYGTRELSWYNVFDFYKYQGPESIRVGDCLLTPEDDSGGHVMVIYDIEVYRDSYQVAYIDTFEQAGSTIETVDDEPMWSRIRRLTVPEFEAFLLENGGRYDIGRYKNAVIRDVEPVRYAGDVIPDMGDRTYYYDGDDVYVYIPDTNVTTLYYKKTTDETFSSILISNLVTATVNDTTVYDVTDIISDYATYELTTDTDNITKCLVTRINVGSITVSGTNVSISGYSSNITPLWTETIYLYTGEMNSASRPCNFDGWIYWKVRESKKMVTSDNFVTPIPAPQYPYQVRVYFETGFGQAYLDSDIIFQT